MVPSSPSNSTSMIRWARSPAGTPPHAHLPTIGMTSPAPMAEPPRFASLGSSSADNYNFQILNLDHNSLSGKIFDLPPSLQYFDLSSNSFTGAISQSIAVNLSLLNLSFNNLSINQMVRMLDILVEYMSFRFLEPLETSVAAADIEGKEQRDDAPTKDDLQKEYRLESDLEQQSYIEELYAHNLLNMEVKENPPQHLYVGCEVKVLCQNTGVTSCWFKASIIKMSKDKAKVCYQDIQDVVDEAKNLEEWVSLSKVVARDGYGLWAIGRKIVRPSLPCAQSKSLSPIGVGTAVDVWRYDGWWEGIVVQGRDKGTFSVYFPGSKISIQRTSLH